MGEFDDLIPAGAGAAATATGVFDDLIPRRAGGGVFDDLIPQPTSTPRRDMGASMPFYQPPFNNEAEPEKLGPPRWYPPLTERIAGRWQAGRLQADADNASYAAMMGQVSPDVAKAARTRAKDAAGDQNLGSDNIVAQGLLGAVGMLPPMLEGTAEGAKYGAALGALGGAVGALPGAVAGVAAGLPAGAVQYWYRQGAGSMYGDLVDEGIDHKTAASVASVFAGPYAAIELAQVERLLPGAKGAFRGAVKGGVREALARLAAQKGKDYAAEITQEEAQELIQIAAEGTARTLAGKERPEDALPIKDRLLKTFAETAKSVPFLMLPGGAVDTVRAVRQGRMDGRTAALSGQEAEGVEPVVEGVDYLPDAGGVDPVEELLAPPPPPAEGERQKAKGKSEVLPGPDYQPLEGQPFEEDGPLPPQTEPEAPPVLPGTGTGLDLSGLEAEPDERALDYGDGGTLPEVQPWPKLPEPPPGGVTTAPAAGEVGGKKEEGGGKAAEVFPSLLEFAKSKLPKSVADQVTSEAQVESFRAQWEKESASVVAVTPAVAAEVRKPEVVKEKQAVAPMAAKVQKKFLLEEIDKALAEAPDVEVTPYPVQGNETSERRDELKKQYAAALAADRARVGTVTIEVPGDGAFEILNTRKALQAFKAKAAKFPTTVPKKAEPGKVRETPTAAPVVGKMEPGAALKAARMGVSEDTEREVINHVWSDGQQSVATDGRRMMIVQAGNGGTAKAPVLVREDGKTEPAKNRGKDAKGNKKGDFPDWRAVVPKESIERGKGLDTGRLWTVLKQALAVWIGHKETQHSVTLVHNKDGSIGLMTSAPEAGEYVHNVQPGWQSITAVNGEYLADGLASARMVGNEKVTISWTDEQAPVVIEGKGFKYVLMPVRLNGGRIEEVAKQEAARVAKMEELAGAARGEGKRKKAKGKSEEGAEAEKSVEEVFRDGYRQALKEASKDARSGLTGQTFGIEAVKKAEALGMSRSTVYQDLVSTGIRPEVVDVLLRGFQDKSGEVAAVPSVDKVAELKAERARVEAQRKAEDAKPRRNGLRSAKGIELQRRVDELDAQIKQAEGAEETRQKAKGESEEADSGKIEDFGAKLGGARKDKWKARGLNVADFDGLTDTEKQSYAEKSQVFPPPDFAGKIAAGMPRGLAWRIKRIYDAILPKPVLSAAEQRDATARSAALRRYVELVGQLRDGLAGVKTQADLTALAMKMFPHGSFTPEQRTVAQAISKVSGRRYSLVVELADNSAWAEQHRTRDLEAWPSWPEPREKWERLFEIRETPAGTKVRDKAGEWRLTESVEWRVVKKVSRSSYQVVSVGHKTEEEAKAAARAMAEASGVEQLTRPLNPNARRSGPDYRKGRDVEGQEILDTFGFRGGEFGNWTNAADRQQSLNQAFDALHDLARTLNIEPRAVGLNGELGIAFGARGSGRASAHYEPGTVVINLTRTRGEGALAHEWAHALDDYFGRLSSGGQSRLFQSESPKAAGGFRAELADKLAAVMAAITKRGWTRPEFEAEVRATHASTKDQAGKWVAAVERATQKVGLTADQKAAADGLKEVLLGVRMPAATEAGRPDLKTVAGDWLSLFSAAARQQGVKIDWPVGSRKESDVASALGWAAGRLHASTDQLARLEAGTLEMVNRTVPTDLLKASEEQGEYWERRHELFARVFEAYVEDTLRGEGFESPYLVQATAGSGAWGNLYPQGAERAATNAAVREFVAQIRTLREGDKIDAKLTEWIEKLKLKPGALYEGVTGLPVWLSQEAAHAALVVVRAAYRAGKHLAEAVREGVVWLEQQGLQGFNDGEAAAWLAASLGEEPLREHAIKQLHAGNRNAAVQAAILAASTREVRSDDEVDAAVAGIIREAGGAEAALPVVNDVRLPLDTRYALALAVANQLNDEVMRLTGQQPAGWLAESNRLAQLVGKFLGEFIPTTTETARGLRQLARLKAMGRQTPIGWDTFARTTIENVNAEQRARLAPVLVALIEELNRLNSEVARATAETKAVQDAARQAAEASVRAEAERQGSEIRNAMVIETTNSIELLPSVRKAKAAATVRALQKIGGAGYWQGLVNKGQAALVKAIEQALNGAGARVNAVTVAEIAQLMTRVLRQQVDATLGTAAQRRQGLPALMKLRVLFGANERMSDFWRGVRGQLANELTEKYGERPEIEALLAQTMDVWSGPLVRAAMKEVLAEQETNLGAVIREHLRGVGTGSIEAARATLAAKIVEAVGLDEQTGERLARAVEAEFDAEMRKQQGEVAERLRKAEENRRKAAAAVPTRKAEQIIKQLAKSQSDTLTWAQAKVDAVRAAVLEQLKTRGLADEDFEAKLVGLGVKPAAAGTLTQVVGREIEVRNRLAQELMFGEDAIDKAIRKALTATGQQLGRIVRTHHSEQAGVGKAVAERLVSEAGLTGPAAERLAAAVLGRFKQLAEQRKRRIVEQMTKPRTARELRKRSVADRIIEASNLGALDEATTWAALAEKLGLAVYTPEHSAEVRRRAELLQRLPVGSVQRIQATARLLAFIAKAHGVKASELAWAVWYANTLSGPMTHLVNSVSNLASLGSGTVAAMRGNPLALPRVFGALLHGFRVGGLEAGAVLRYGSEAKRAKFDTHQHALELLGPEAFTGARLVAGLKYVGRALAAADALFYFPAREVKSVQLAHALARGEGLRGAELARRRDEVMHGTDAQEADWRAQIGREAAGVEAAGMPADRLWRARRLQQLREENRPGAMVESADDFALKLTFNNQPTGLMGLVSGWASQATRQLPAARLVVPFINIVGNVVNESLNYTPWGFARGAAAGRNGVPSVLATFNEAARRGSVPVTPDAVIDLHAKAAMGTLLFAGMALAAAAGGGGDDDGRRFQINGAGPRRSDGKMDAEKLKALKAAGWIPYSVRVGGRYYSFTSTPLAVPLAILGNYLDEARFNPKEWEQTQALDRAVFALWSSASVFAQMSFIDSAARLMGWVHDGGRPKKMGDNLVEVVGRSAGSIVIPNALRQLDRMQDPTVYDGRGLAGAIAASVPFARRANEVALNAVGEPEAASPWARFASDAKPGIMQELAARGLWIAVPSPDDVLPDIGRKLEPAEFHQYVKLSGEMIRKALAEDGQWRRLDAENAQRLVGEHVAESRHRARVLLGFEAPVDLPKAPKPYVPPVRLFGR